jgi:hypothetical protein
MLRESLVDLQDERVIAGIGVALESILTISPQFARLCSGRLSLNHLGALVRSRTDRESDRAYFPPSERFE